MEKTLVQRQSDCLKIVLFGPESTGKTTLAKQLAAHFKTKWVPEYMRTYLQNKWDENAQKISKEDLLPIAKGQVASENKLTRKVTKLLFCDTNLLELQVYCEYYYDGWCPSEIKKAVENQHYDYYFLTHIDVPWYPDDLRDRPNDRSAIFRSFEKALTSRQIPYTILSGSQEKRLNTAIEILQKKTLYYSMLTKKDIQQIEENGLTVKQVVSQLETFAKGIPPSKIITAATVGNGIEQISEDNKRELIALFEKFKTKKTIVKFVPASGAATRMFKFLFEFLDDFNPGAETFNRYIKKGNYAQLELFSKSLKEFAFVNEVRKKIRENYPEYKQSRKGARLQYFVKSMLEEKGLNFAHLPKGLIPFHKYKKYATTAFEEQLYESAFYATSKDDAYLHFTFSEPHVPHFKQKFETIKNRVSKKTKTEFHISYSFQKPETNTVAVTPENKPFRDENNKLVFRPSGHGALLENLNEVNADLVFIKNIDNVTAQEYTENVAEYKKMLAGKLLAVQEKVFHYLKLLKSKKISEETISELKSFLWNELNIKDIPSSKEALFFILNRPIRVCGMVKNTGAPGGGPFWVKQVNGQTSLQIVEMAQIDTTVKHQMNLVKEATHFNPVDLVCGVKDYKGNKFNLTKFSDPNTGFISTKSQHGRPLKALELPGLWNGAMARWNTILIEVPLSTFNPVKTVNDLLQKEHRPDA